MFNDVIGHAPLYDAPNGEQVCDFRAPTTFFARGKSGDEWVFIGGDSAGCRVILSWQANRSDPFGQSGRSIQFNDGEIVAESVVIIIWISVDICGSNDFHDRCRVSVSGVAQIVKAEEDFG